jgi:hypothetical protein
MRQMAGAETELAFDFVVMFIECAAGGNDAQGHFF